MVDIDKYGLYGWHLERTTIMLDALQDKFGSKIMDIVLEYEISKRIEDGINQAKKLGKSHMLYNLHCGLDKYFVQGFNNELGCEVIKSIMEGHEYCIHRIYKKNNF